MLSPQKFIFLLSGFSPILLLHAQGTSRALTDSAAPTSFCESPDVEFFFVEGRWWNYNIQAYNTTVLPSYPEYNTLFQPIIDGSLVYHNLAIQIFEGASGCTNPYDNTDFSPTAAPTDAKTTSTSTKEPKSKKGLKASKSTKEPKSTKASKKLGKKGTKESKADTTAKKATKGSNDIELLEAVTVQPTAPATEETTLPDIGTLLLEVIFSLTNSSTQINRFNVVNPEHPENLVYPGIFNAIVCALHQDILLVVVDYHGLITGTDIATAYLEEAIQSTAEYNNATELDLSLC